MRILALTQTGPLGPSSRYRVYQLLPWLERLGIATEVSPALDDELYRALHLAANGPIRARGAALWSAIRTRRRDLRRAPSFDAVLVQKGVLPGLYAGYEKALAGIRPLVFDFDDAIWLPRAGGHPLGRLFHRENTVCAALRRAAAVTAGNEFLAGYARRFNPRVTVVPSAIDLSRYPPPVIGRPQPARRSASAAVPRVGWIGSRTTLAYLQPLAPVFRALRVRPRIIAAGNPADHGLDAEFVAWHPDIEITELTGLDIGLAPLPDTPWEQGKCGVKLLQYLACGLAVIASPVGVQRQIVRHGENGLLASTPREWAEALRRLLGDPDLRWRLGAAGRRTVEQEFEVRQAADRLAAVLRQAIECPAG